MHDPDRGLLIALLQGVLHLEEVVGLDGRGRVAGAGVAAGRNAAGVGDEQPERLSRAGARQERLFLGDAELVGELVADDAVDVGHPQRLLRHLDELGREIRGHLPLAEVHLSVFVGARDLTRPGGVLGAGIQRWHADGLRHVLLDDGRPGADEYPVADRLDQPVDELLRRDEVSAGLLGIDLHGAHFAVSLVVVLAMADIDHAADALLVGAEGIESAAVAQVLAQRAQLELFVARAVGLGLVGVRPRGRRIDAMVQMLLALVGLELPIDDLLDLGHALFAAVVGAPVVARHRLAGLDLGLQKPLVLGPEVAQLEL